MSQPRLIHLAAVAAGGAIGALLRVAFATRFPTLPGQFPITTLAENVVGAFLLGALLMLLHDRLRDGKTLYLFACTGILGSFTTFSNVSVEIVNLAVEQSYAHALLYPLASVAAGLAAAFAGMRAAHGLARPRRKGGA